MNDPDLAVVEFVLTAGWYSENRDLEPDDLPPVGERVWLKGYGCVRHTDAGFEFTGDDLDVTRQQGVDIVHWVPSDDNVEVRLRTMDGTVTGYAEPGVAAHDPDDLLQFERVGFARIDALPAANRGLVAYYAHP